jgi:UMF1 family MFS transporter
MFFKSDSPSQRAWYFYDWANSAYITTTTTVFFGPYLTSIAESAAGCTGDVCDASLAVGPLSIAPGSLFFYVITLTTLVSAFLLPLVGAYADLRHDKQKLMAHFAWVGAIAASLMFFVSGTSWLLGSLLLIIGNLAMGGSLVVYDAILCDIAAPDERDRVSSRGWAMGYIGGGLLLIVNLAMWLLAPADFSELAVRISLLSAGLWWGLWTFVPYRRIKNSADKPLGQVQFAKLAAGSFGQLAKTLRELANFPQTRLFLVAYLFFNDGVQTVIASASVYGSEELQLGQTALVGAIVIVQIVAIFGALFTGKVAARIGAYRTVLNSLLVWTVVIVAGYFVPAGKATFFFLLAAAIGFILGGTQALSRSLFSQLVPRAREAEYFALYQACERGTSWLGTLAFGLVFQMSGSYRPAILMLIAFFVVGGLLLRKVDVRAGIKAAGNEQPAIA